MIACQMIILLSCSRGHLRGGCSVISPAARRRAFLSRLACFAAALLQVNVETSQVMAGILRERTVNAIECAEATSNDGAAIYGIPRYSLCRLIIRKYR